ARRLDEDGFKVFAGCLDAKGEGPKKLQSECSPKLEILQLDVTSEEQIEAARVKVVDSLMGNILWAVVNNAGVMIDVEFEVTPKRDFKKLMDVNIMGVVNVTRAFLPLIRASKGRVVNTASMAGRTGMPGMTAYAASKFAVIGFSDALRREMRHFGVKVITIEPCAYNTAMTSVSMHHAQNENFWSNAEPGIRRDYGETFFSEHQTARDRIVRSTARAQTDEVVNCYVDAVSSVHPKIRYVTPFVMSVLNDFMCFLFTSVQDAIIHRLAGLRSRPDMLCAHLQESRSTGRRRSHAM
ncbi:retinol dehydrogenase 16-like, partial [Physella acuta]|uniref:retinol dehydrogenase 16-like n=1 Tax=Physella acuta TaxID=109671 RepID=UPI0027DCFECC